MKKVPLAALLSCGNLLAGLGALLAAVNLEFVLAASLVALAAALDLADGAVARRRGTDGEFGANLDSLADLVSFGVAPAAALYLGASGGQPASYVHVLAGLACALFVVCGALRLARFPLLKSPNHFVGLPIPPAGLAVSLLAALETPASFAAPILLILCALMVGTLRFPNPNALSLARVRLPGKDPRSGKPGLTQTGTGTYPDVRTECGPRSEARRDA